MFRGARGGIVPALTRGMSGVSKAWNAVVALSIGAWAVACSAPVPQKTPLIVCEAGEDGCPSDKPKSSKQTSKKTNDDNGPSGSPASATPDDDETPGTNPDAGTDTPVEEKPGPICTNLKACCDQLKAAGYSDATCLEIVDTKSESACSLQHKQYKDFGDCS